MDSVEDGEALGFLSFWLGAGREAWFGRADGFDAKCAQWIGLWERARAGECDRWAATAAGSLALVVLLDQIPRNVFRGSAQQFVTDAKALGVAERAVEAGHDRAHPLPARLFCYLPFEHAEDLAAQERCLDLLRPLGDRDAYFWALVHADAIRRFGRFPHRNAILGRRMTPAEEAYLSTGGFAG